MSCFVSYFVDIFPESMEVVPAIFVGFGRRPDYSRTLSIYSCWSSLGTFLGVGWLELPTLSLLFMGWVETNCWRLGFFKASLAVETFGVVVLVFKDDGDGDGDL